MAGDDNRPTAVFLGEHQFSSPRTQSMKLVSLNDQYDASRVYHAMSKENGGLCYTRVGAGTPYSLERSWKPYQTAYILYVYRELD